MTGGIYRFKKKNRIFFKKWGHMQLRHCPDVRYRALKFQTAGH